ncbi:uncharacterized protein MONOS_7543 [Monocercomonoides exilis]|uniref:uncharacterized protein n=1 Tax=Monocercomonoides exilis TaxID=2049356 RepID=UPI00355A02A5|nr:hypothetical protein MONOS_7543 [Monocercomonoides exilis]|eukprot:MONOS_7543.1-p1 / transcript=MONOS_7543.1 / gene=MONOS_7543 / organism=Monocercomonoides_exilis_PA203 / gene_product=unspecified product / transcript_product=unspecified product / location=Mono_scaffold00260:20915-21271(+) / protein_length=119 / sequence_SO=supercontig / SO=protein_coding / is_pseudo=false
MCRILIRPIHQLWLHKTCRQQQWTTSKGDCEFWCLMWLGCIGGTCRCRCSCCCNRWRCRDMLWCERRCCMGVVCASDEALLVMLSVPLVAPLPSLAASVDTKSGSKRIFAAADVNALP